MLSILSALSVSPASSSLSAPSLADTTRKKTDSLPLARTRTIEFETSEGTWLSLDVSPDGRTIVFELMGDIYTLPIAGGAGDRDHLRPALRLPAALVAGRQAPCLPERS